MGRRQESLGTPFPRTPTVALSLVCVHCKKVREEKLVALKVANTKRLQFRSFMDTFIEAATRIADGIDLDEFVEPTSPPPVE